jgi:hypothetical protein
VDEEGQYRVVREACRRNGGERQAGTLNPKRQTLKP